MDRDLYDAAHGAVQVANALQHSLSTLITREWFDKAEEDQEVPQQDPRGA